MNEALPPKQHQYEGALARSYETERSRETKWGRENAIVASFLDQVDKRSMKVLDVPVGTGRFLGEYAKRGYIVVGIDASEDMLSESRVRLKAEPLGFEEVRLELGNVTALDIGTSEVDVTICIRLLNLLRLSEVEAAMAEIARVSSGHVIVGIRTHGSAGAARRMASRVRSVIRRSPPKLTIHRDLDIDRIIQTVGLQIDAKSLVASGAHNSSAYYIYLLGRRTRK